MAAYYLTIVALTMSGYFLAKEKEQKTAVLYLVVSFFVLVFFASFRYAIGFDYFSYRRIYELASKKTFRELFTLHLHEPLLYFVCRFFCLLGCSYHGFLFCINSFLFFTAMQFIRRYSRLPWISVYLFITLQFLSFSMNLLRQSIAVSFFLLSYPYLKSRKIVPYTILILVGGLFHNSLLVMWSLYIFLPRKNSRRFWIGVFVLTALVYVLFDPLFAVVRPYLVKRYANYLGSYYWQPNKWSYVFPPAGYAALIVIFRNRISEPERRAVYVNGAVYQFLISLFITKHFILERFAVYPFVFSLIAVPEIIDSYQKKKTKDKKHCWEYYGILAVFLIFGAAYFFFAAVKGYHGVYPYVSLLRRSRSVGN